MYRAIVCLLVAAMASGCYSRSIVHGTSVSALQRGNHGQTLVLRDVKGGHVHVDPRSRLRFYRSDGLWTAWVYARDLRVSQQGVFHRGRGDATLQGLSWQNIRGVEVKNLSGGKTYAAVVGTTIIIAAVVIIIVAMVAGKGGGGGGKIKVPRFRGGHGHAHIGHIGRGAGAAARGLARAAGRAGYTLTRAWASGWRWYGPEIRIQVNVPVQTYDAPAGPPTGTPPPTTTAPPGGDPSAGAPPPPPPAPGAGAGAAPPNASGPLAVPRIQTTPLFTHRALRRSRIRLVTAVEGGSDFTINDGGLWNAFLGMRLRDIFEIGGGVRMLSFQQTDPMGFETRETHWVGYGRFLMHFEVDPWRRVALPFGFDIGGGNPAIYVRAILGIRVRIVDGFSLGLYPFNPTFTYVKNDGGIDGQRGYSGVTFPTTFEASYAF